MPTITAKPFEKDIQTLLSELESGYHAGELSKKDRSELPENIFLIEDDDTLVGYAVIWEYQTGKHP